MEGNMSNHRNFRIAASAVIGAGLFLALTAPQSEARAATGFSGTPQTIKQLCYRKQLKFWQNKRLEKFGCRDERKLVIVCVDTECAPPPPPPTVILYLKKGGGDEKEDGGERGGGGNPNGSTIN
jgi:hypothetical protein